MLTLPQEMMTVILPFVALFSERVWNYAQILLMGSLYRIKTRLGCCEGVLTLVKGSCFDCPPQVGIGRVTIKGEVILRNGQRFVDIREDVAVIQMEKAPSQMIPLTLHTQMPATANSWLV